MRARWTSLRSSERAALGAGVLVLALVAAHAFTGVVRAVVTAMLGLAPVVVWLQRRWADTIDARIARLVGRQRMRRMRVYTKDFPGFRLVDLFRATDRFCHESGAPEVIESHHEHEDLNSLLHGTANDWARRCGLMLPTRPSRGFTTPTATGTGTP